MKPKDEFRNIEINGVWWHAITEPGTKDELRFAVNQLKKYHAEWRWLPDGDLWRVGIPLEEVKRIEKKNVLEMSRRKVENRGNEFSDYRRENDIPKQEVSGEG